MAIGGVLFDIDGVLVTSWKPIEGAAETLQVMARNQIACSYLTNTTTRTREQIAEALADAGIIVRPDEVITLRTGSPVEQLVRDATDLTSSVPPWLQADHEGLSGKVLKWPERDEIDAPVQESLIVELYSK